MNKTDRMLAIVLELQRKGVVRAEDLASVFETSVRTIYRDIQALSEAGVPVVGATGQGYSLVKGISCPGQLHRRGGSDPADRDGFRGAAVRHSVW